MLAFKVTTVGASAGFIFAEEAMARLKVQKGDTVYPTGAPEGSYRITPYDPDFERQMKLAEEIARRPRYLAGAGQVPAWRWVRAGRVSPKASRSVPPGPSAPRCHLQSRRSGGPRKSTPHFAANAF